MNEPRSFASRFLANAWALFALGFIASYTANLATFMMTTTPYDDLKGLNDSKVFTLKLIFGFMFIVSVLISVYRPTGQYVDQRQKVMVI